jgi:hypothetical protein
VKLLAKISTQSSLCQIKHPSENPIAINTFSTYPHNIHPVFYASKYLKFHRQKQRKEIQQNQEEISEKKRERR